MHVMLEGIAKIIKMEVSVNFCTVHSTIICYILSPQVTRILC